MKNVVLSPTRDTAKIFFRILVIAVISAGMAKWIPFITEDAVIRGFFYNQVLNMGLLYAILLGFFMSMAISRRQSIDLNVQVELNKIRRIYHLCLHMMKSESRLAPWFADVKRALRGYQDFFCNDRLMKYEEGNRLFRNITYSIYDLPSRGIQYSSDLYGVVLGATSSATEARQYIRAKLAQPISVFQWLTIVVITLTLSAILVTAAPPNVETRLVTAIVIFNMLLVIELLYDFDRTDAHSERAIARQYAHNLPEVSVCGPETSAGKRGAARKRSAA